MLDLPAGDAWRETTAPALLFLEGNDTLVLKAQACDACRVEAIRVD